MLRPTLIGFALVSLAGCGSSSTTATPEAQPAAPPVNYGASTLAKVKPFKATPVATFDTPWALAFLPGGTMLVTEKPGHLWLVQPTGTKTEVGGVPAVHA